jgi:predicted RND superfamily exporter protein
MQGDEAGDDSRGTTIDRVRGDISSRIDTGKEAIENMDIDSVTGSLKRIPNAIRRNLANASGTSILTRAPAITVALCLIVTGFFTLHSGILDCRDGFDNPDYCQEESALNVNGDLEVYLPEGNDVTELLASVEENWTTNVMVVYVESESLNVTSVEILEEIDAIERELNYARNDRGSQDNIIYLLSISTVIKEVNSSAGRIAKATFAALAEATGNGDLTDDFNDTIDEQQDIIGSYSIPDQQRVDQILDEMPQNALDKLVRDVGKDFNDDGITDQVTSGHGWNRGVIIIGIESDRNGDGVDDVEISELILETQGAINALGQQNDWADKNLTMTLTGPVPITNAVTEESFKLFWKVFPIGGIFVALGLFIFHCDLLQTGRIRWVQGLKVLIISGLPTLCSVWITLGIIGFTNYEVTMTVIIVGPIVLALGVSYGLHITNRYAEASGTPREKMEIALSSTGRAVMLSAITTIIGFYSLTFTPMAPIKTVGYTLAGGIVVVYIMTMLMVPNLTMMLDLKKPSHPPPKLFVGAVGVPIKWTKIALSLFIIAMIISAGFSRQNVEENIDLLEMAPSEGADGNPVMAVEKMGDYSNEFEAGQPGFLLIDDAKLSADPSLFDLTVNDPYDSLRGIEALEQNCNRVDQTTAVSIVFLMKAIAVGVNVSGQPIVDIIDEWPLPDQIKETLGFIFGREVAGNGSFWETLAALEGAPSGDDQAHNFLIYIFYNSMTTEMRELFISSDYDRSLIYIDMPFMDVKSTEKATNEVNHWVDVTEGVKSSELVGVASVTIAVNSLIVDSQWTSLGFALLATILALGLVFRDLRFALLTTVPVGFTVAMQWLAMDSLGVPLSLVTVMVGSILVGVGIDFSIHIANRVKEQGGTIEAVSVACASTGMSLFEAVTVTAFGLFSAYLIPIEAIKPFVTVVIILLIVAALSALLLLPAVFSLLIKANVSLTGGVETMVRTAGLRRAVAKDEADAIDATLLLGASDDAW